MNKTGKVQGQKANTLTTIGRKKIAKGYCGAGRVGGKRQVEEHKGIRNGNEKANRMQTNKVAHKTGGP